MKLIAGNWKMHNTIIESLEVVNALRDKVKHVKDREILVCPPFTSLAMVADAIKKTNIKLGAQNMHHEDNGAFTGEIAAPMLTDIDVDYVILGHSERRTIFHESNELINKKVKKAIASRLTPILCVGENIEERTKGKQEEVVAQQFRECLNDVTSAKIVIAYEPIWAIGTGKTATPQQAQEMHAFIKGLCKEKYKKDIRVIYGGSVNEKNVDTLMREKDIDGCLVGGASLNAEQFARIVEYKD